MLGTVTRSKAWFPLMEKRADYHPSLIGCLGLSSHLHPTQQTPKLPAFLPVTPAASCSHLQALRMLFPLPVMPFLLPDLGNPFLSLKHSSGVISSKLPFCQSHYSFHPHSRYDTLSGFLTAGIRHRLKVTLIKES